MRSIIIFIALTLLANNVQAEVTARFDSPQVTLNQTLTLVIRTSSIKRNVSPDLSALAGYFEEINRQTSTRIVSRNGATTSITEWHVQLLPLTTGKIDIDTIIVDGEFAPAVSVNVLPDPNNATTAGADYFVTATIDNPNPYVQEMVTLTVDVATRVNLRNWNSPELTIPDVQRIALQTKRKEITHLGYDYVVFQLRYALFAQRSGKLTIPEILYSATLSQPSNRSLSMMSRPGRRVFIRSNPITIDVLPRPAPTDSPWLPASDLAISLSAPVQQPYQAGDDLSFELRVVASNALQSQIPDLDIPEQQTASLYTERPERSATELDDGINSQLVQQFTIVPNSGGELVIDSFEVVWFNTETQQYERASTQPLTYQIDGPIAALEDTPLATDTLPEGSPTIEPNASIDEQTPTAQSNAQGTSILELVKGLLPIGIAVMLLIAAMIGGAYLVKRRTRPIYRLPSNQFYQALVSLVHSQRRCALSQLNLDRVDKQLVDQLASGNELSASAKKQLYRRVISALNSKDSNYALSVLNT